MIKPKRIGHATFETPDLDKAIAYYEKFMGLIVAEREKDRAFLATKVGQLVIELDKADRAHCIKLSFEVAPKSDFGDLAKELSKDGVRSELRNDFDPRNGSGAVRSRTTRAPRSSCSRNGAIFGKHEQVAGIGPFKLGHVAFFTPDIRRTVAFYEKVPRIPGLRLDRRFLLLHALQHRPSHREFLHRADRTAPSHRVRAQGFHAPAEFM